MSGLYTKTTGCFRSRGRTSTRDPANTSATFAVTWSPARTGVTPEQLSVPEPPFDIAVGRCAVLEDSFGNALCTLDMSKEPRQVSRPDG